MYITGRICSILSCGLYSFCVLYMYIPYINVGVADIITHILEGNTILYVQHQGKEYAVNMIYMWPDSTIILPGGGTEAESIYRGLGFLAVVCFGSSHTISPSPSSVSKLDRRHTGRLRKRDTLQTGVRVRGVGRSQIIQRRIRFIIDTLWMGGGGGGLCFGLHKGDKRGRGFFMVIKNDGLF
jgi:hypothetical protein